MQISVRPGRIEQIERQTYQPVSKQLTELYQNLLQFSGDSSKLSGMMEPLALVLYEKLLPGSQVVNRLQDLKYRVETISDATRLVECAQQSGPMIVLVDLESAKENVCAEIARLKQTPATRHLPVIAFSNERLTSLQEAAKNAGVSLVVSDAAILTHLPQFLEHALQLD